MGRKIGRVWGPPVEVWGSSTIFNAREGVLFASIVYEDCVIAGFELHFDQLENPAEAFNSGSNRQAPAMWSVCNSPMKSRNSVCPW